VLISGGEAPNMVPERCRITCDRRLIPGEREDEVLADFSAMLNRFNRDNPGVTARLVELAPSTGGPSETVPDDPLVIDALAALRQIGQNPAISGMQVNCDMSHFRRVGIPAVVYGPGSPAAMHTVDESIDLAEIDHAAAGYAAIVHRVLERSA
jgi:succinyl-diaminopimelate desuccinylase